MENVRDHKCVIILKSELPLGFAANAAAVLAISIGGKRPEIIAEDLKDGSGLPHAGLVNVPVPVLQSDAAQLKQIRDAAATNGDLTLVDFSEPARVARTFEDYRDRLAATSQSELEYVGLAILGPKKAVSALTAGLALLR